MELRDIEIFLTLAEELHFARTAARLRVTPARVSQSISQQERRIGAALFERTSRTVRLTAVGEQLRRDLHPIYHGLKASMERARLAAQGITDILRIGTIAFNVQDLKPYWHTFRSRHHGWGLRLRYSQFNEAFPQLRRGDIDVLIAWLPVEEPGLTIGPVIFTEPRTLAVPVRHPLADHSPVPLEALGDGHCVVTAQPYVPDYWEDAHVPFATPSGRPIDRRLPVATFEEILLYVTTGQAIHPTAAHAAHLYTRPDITYLPLADAPNLRWALIWRDDHDNPLIPALSQIVQDLGTLHQ